MGVTTTPARTALDWLDAAYTRFAEAGLSAVRVEALARDLGATKGSFYWHYSDRQALIDAVMIRWERTETDALIDVASAGGSPRERLALLYRAVGETAERRRGESRLYVEAAAERVREVVARVSQKRVDYIASILEADGMRPEEARRRGIISLATAIGLEQLTTATGLEVVNADSESLTSSALRMAFAD
jgi:AcrR family transcriptional regulator